MYFICRENGVSLGNKHILDYLLTIEFSEGQRSKFLKKLIADEGVISELLKLLGPTFDVTVTTDKFGSLASDLDGKFGEKSHDIIEELTQLCSSENNILFKKGDSVTRDSVAEVISKFHILDRTCNFYESMKSILNEHTKSFVQKEDRVRLQINFEKLYEAAEDGMGSTLSLVIDKSIARRLGEELILASSGEVDMFETKVIRVREDEIPMEEKGKRNREG